MGRRPKAAAASRGFTLVELMVVIGIIGLLVAIALPSLNAARVAAKRVATEATINVLGTGVEQFHVDTAIGGTYPPSVRLFTPDPFGASKKREIEVGGATLLVWALAGADLLGSPGFRNIDNDSANDPMGGWISDQHRGNNGLYQLDPTTGKPVVSRSKAYVDMSKVKLAKQVAAGSNFQIPSITSPTDPQRYGNVFLDQFDQPILYYKANPNAPNYVSSGQKAMNQLGTINGGNESGYAVSTTGRYQPMGVYDLRDNSIFTGNGSEPGADMGAGPDANNRIHPISELVRTAALNPATAQPRGCFAQVVQNSNVTNVFQPQRDDSFILLSAGNDGRFGTADDIANFPINK